MMRKQDARSCTLTCDFNGSLDDDLLAGAVGGGQRARPAALVDRSPCQQDATPLRTPRTENHDRASLQIKSRGRSLPGDSETHLKSHI